MGPRIRIPGPPASVRAVSPFVGGWLALYSPALALRFFLVGGQVTGTSVHIQAKQVTGGWLAVGCDVCGEWASEGVASVYDNPVADRQGGLPEQ